MSAPFRHGNNDEGQLTAGRSPQTLRPCPAGKRRDLSRPGPPATRPDETRRDHPGTTGRRSIHRGERAGARSSTLLSDRPDHPRCPTPRRTLSYQHNNNSRVT